MRLSKEGALALLVVGVLGCAGAEVRGAGGPEPVLREEAGSVAVPEAAALGKEPSRSGAVSSAGPGNPAGAVHGVNTDSQTRVDAAARNEGAEVRANTAGVDPAASPDRTAGEDPTVEALYQQCLERVEGREADNECTADTDCIAAGCSTEICTTKAAAEGLMSTCENRPCFAVLDSCGCDQGRCQWSLKSAVPPGGPSCVLPPQ